MNDTFSVNVIEMMIYIIRRKKVQLITVFANFIREDIPFNKLVKKYSNENFDKYLKY